MKHEQTNVCGHEAEHALAAERARRNMPGEGEVERVAAGFKAISEPSRLKILFAAAKPSRRAQRTP